MRKVPVWWLLLTSSAGPGPSVGSPDPWATIIGYGVASPVIALLLWLWNRAVKEREEALTRIDVVRKEANDQLEALRSKCEDRVEAERKAAGEQVRRERERAEAMSERLLSQQSELLPLTRDMVGSLKQLEKLL